MIELKEVCKSFENVKAVDNISFKAKKGEIFGLLGPNGAGKSTTIRMIMNILMPDNGAILFDGKPVIEKDKERIGYLPEERGLYKKVKVNELLLYFASLKGRQKTFSRKRIDYWLDRFDLTDWKERKTEELSKGMSQKVQFIASLVHDPDLLFLDEPFSGIDPVSTDLMIDTILDLQKQGKTILFSTHIMENAEKICNTIFLIHKGKEVISGPLDKIKDTYGKRAIVIEFDGDGGFLDTLPFVEQAVWYPRWVEVNLSESGTPEMLLRALLGKVQIRKFEIRSPSLHSIFISRVGR